jgi:hypothetical protein
MIALVAGGEARLARVDGSVVIHVDPALAPDPERAGIVQAGTLDAGRGQVNLTAGDAYSLAMNHSGVTRAAEITVAGGQDGLVEVSGVLDASGDAAGDTGGRIAVLGDLVLLDGATLDASGEAGGGLITWSTRGALEGLLTGGVLRLFIGQHGTWCINSLNHLIGTRPFRTGDLSTNIGWMAIPTMGGSWHNNHHAFPNTASNQLSWWQIDPCYWVIAALARVGLVTDVKVPTADQVRAKRAASSRKPTAAKESLP